jgi:SAM-dependent methyltransferase
MASGSGVPERLRWAVRLLDPQPGERILEVGCGPGVAAALVCARLTGGLLVATDRSATAVERTSRRNAGHVDAGRLVVVQAALADLPAPDEPFARIDKAFCVNVNLFWTGPAERELAVLRRALRPGGTLHVLFGAGGPTSGERVLSPVSAALREHGFTDVSAVEDEDGLGVSGVAAEAGGA